ncbi:ER protein Pkr1 [Colletotrichum higginsianum IMI 349063]|uniref:ER protein Pkr1 n=2 Tax=Colletotrichum higginsianum TaxID=80884 RepID=A0A1B7YV88_COLHI|nr:ER protein Pkr1 [Colletotrichum higginsianum IMI 349063]OBR15854.1 ER protein Pkr1 [Colletotrichum higginsianum IMI 349063]TID04369.1 V-type ATPase assembly factor PKR1 [Colletotrichum higginsianum]
MASFVTNLWESIFIPGPTPTLVRAANATFAALQVLLAVLLLTTWSIHFVILSFLSGFLWFSINWFVNELAIHAEQEAKKARLAESSSSGVGGGGGGGGGNTQGTDDSDTEVEGAVAGGVGARKKGAAVGSSQVETAQQQQQAADLKRRTAAAVAAAAAESGAEDATNGGTQSSVSTEDEWEKVSENENEKDK